VRIGYYISGAGHISLILWVLFGGAFKSNRPPFEVTEVSVISGAEFEALMAGVQAPEVVTDVAMPAPDLPADVAQPAESQPDPTPPPPPEPQVTEAPPPDPVPQQPDPLPQDNTEVADVAPVIAPPPPEDLVLAPRQSDRPVPRPAERVAPEPVAAPEPDTQVADSLTEEVVEDQSAEIVREATEGGAPEEATTRIVTEAMEEPASAAPTSSVRPQTRPARPTPAPVAETPRPQPTQQAQQQPTPTPAPSTTDAVNDALRQAMAGAASPAAGGQSGPPMTSGERDALRVAVQQCWNVGSLSSEALRTTVVVAVSMSEDGRPMAETLRMLGHEGGSAEAARQAFESARRAIIRCGANGFNLPRDKYEQWRNIEMTFNPENMRIR
jgi:hypothetical protein